MIPIIFAEKKGTYSEYDFCDVYDIERDAFTWKGTVPAIFHPPLAEWLFDVIEIIKERRKIRGVTTTPPYVQCSVITKRRLND